MGPSMPAATGALERIAELIRHEGPVTFAAYMEHALYDPEHGYFVRGGGAGRAGHDFVTSPEVGSLFVARVARALDETWVALGEPDPFVVVEAAAGRGRLAADVLRAEPRCARALRYVLVERSARLRTAQHDLVTIETVDEALGPFFAPVDDDGETEPVPGAGPIVTALDDLPAMRIDGLVLANELLDNLPVRIVERGNGSWSEVRIGLDDDGALGEVLLDAPEGLAAEAELVAAGATVPIGARLPVPVGAQAWLERVAALLARGTLVLVDYAVPVLELLERGAEGWLRTYRSHDRGGPPLEDPGAQDITYDLPLEYLMLLGRRFGFELALGAAEEAVQRVVRCRQHDRRFVAVQRGALDAGGVQPDAVPGLGDRHR